MNEEMGFAVTHPGFLSKIKGEESALLTRLVGAIPCGIFMKELDGTARSGSMSMRNQNLAIGGSGANPP